jgi:hypothetical protein
VSEEIDLSPTQVREFVFMAMAQHETECVGCSRAFSETRQSGVPPDRSTMCPEMLEMIDSLMTLDCAP